MKLIRKIGISIILACFVLGSQATFSARAAPTQVEISAEGELCTQAYGAVFCFPLTFTFKTEGGPVSGSSSGSTSFPIEGVGTIASSFNAVFEGTFAGGDGGTLEGTWTSTANVTLPEGLSLPADMPALTQSSAGGTWSGTLYADGTGSGTFQAVDSFGVSSSGTWAVTYSGSAFGTPQPTQTTQPTQTAKAPAATTTATSIPPTPTLVPSPGPTLDPQALLALGDLQSAIQEQLARLQLGDLSEYPVTLSRWLYGDVVRVNVEDETPVVTDIFGHSVAVNENGLPQGDASVIESPSAEVINNHPDMDWSSLFDSIGERAYNAFNNFTEPTFQFIEETTDGIKPSEIASDFYEYLKQLPVTPDDSLSPEESSIVKTEVAIHQSQEGQEQQEIEGSDGEKVDVQEAVDKVGEEEEDTWKRHYVEVLEIISAERWDELVSQGIDPVQLIRNRKTADETLVKFNEFFGGQSMSDLAVKFDLLPEEVNSMKLKLRALGVRPDKVEELAQATLALRVITELASDHTISSDGYFDKVVWAFKFLAINRASQDALMDELEGKVQLSPEQIDLIMENRGSAVVEALTGKKDAENDPLLQAIMQEIGRRDPK